ncbi:PAS domain S-box protein [Roseospira navarrensis]|uniref:Sensory/regulatory protein RpfC n=1 Tax=Roseospira navarrensis TaxID=140058 RepID=A0A7X2D4P2_9PROT|nr:PAS domain S-box protein [Roseospira navarrensis]MQX38138.1 PAS domain S-box protein [Roseospira navarrensis]
MVSANGAAGAPGATAPHPGRTDRLDAVAGTDAGFRLLDDLGDAVYVHDLDGRLVAFNEPACTALGYSRADLAGMSVADFETTVTRAQIAAACRQIRADGTPFTHTGVHRRKDGGLVPVEMRSTAIVRDDQDLILTVARDVSDLHRAERILGESEQRFRSLIEHSPFGIAVTLPNGQPLMVNRRLAELLGRPRADLERMSFHEIYDRPEDRDRLLELYAFRGRVLDHEVSLRVHDPGTTTDGARWFLVSWQPTRFEGQDAIVSWYQDVNHRHIAGEEMRDLHAELQYRIEERTRELGVEITERRYAEAALKEANEFLEQKVEERTHYLKREIDQRRRAEKEREKTEMELLDIIETAPIAVGIADQNGRFLFWNPLFFRLGRQHMEESGKVNFGLDFVEPGLMRALQAQVIGGERVEHVEARLVTSDEDARWVLVSMRKLTFEGQAALLTWVFDITDMKEQAEALEEARLAAEASARAKSAFLATMSHEIRTPMNGVITMAEMLAQTDLEPDQRHMLDVVIDSAGALLAIIDEILDFSKIEAGRIVLEAVDLSLVQLIERVADLLAPKAEQKGLDLLCWTEPGIPDHFDGDPNRLRQILVNLAGNAIKFTETGHVTIHASLSVADVPDPSDPGAPRWIRFEVRDTGIGMTESQLARLFQPFSQADSSTQRRFGGTGLGLSISHTLVDVMGGRIGVDSHPGAGTLFWFEVPLRPRPERRALDPHPIAGARVLTISDSAPGRDLLERILLWGEAAPVMTADMDAARAALMHALVQDRPFDAVIVDRHVDGAPGARRLEEIRRLGGATPPPVLMVVPRGSRETSRIGELTGVSGVIGWPLHRYEMTFTLSVALGRTPPDAVCPWRRRSSDKPIGGGIGHFIAPDRATAETAGCVVLLAEDNPTNQTVIRMLMERLGLVADLAGDGREALKLFETHPYGLVLTDCHMPEMDGYDLTERIRAHETEARDARRTPVVALTADAIAGTARQCLDRGMDDYLTKPVAIADLEAAIAKWLPQALELRRPRMAAPPLPEPQPDPQPEAAAAPSPATAPPDADASNSAPSPGCGEPVLDTAYMLDLVGGDATMLKGLLEEFVSATAGDVDAAEAAFADGRLSDAQKAVHAVSGAARSAGAGHLGALCKRIEAALLEGDPETARRLKDGIRPAFEAAAAAIRAL